jgi:hypothetical protein
MIEFAATMIVISGAIAATVAAGTRYLDTHAKYRTLSDSQAKNEPLIRPGYPSGRDWPELTSWRIDERVMPGRVTRAWQWLYAETRTTLAREAIRYASLTALSVIVGWTLVVVNALFHLKQPLTLQAISDRGLELLTRLADHPYDSTVGLIKSDPIHAISGVIIGAGIVTFGFLLRRARSRIDQLEHRINDATVARALVAEAGLGGRWPHARREQGGAPWNDVQSEILRPENNILYILGANGVDTFGRNASPLYECLRQFRHETRIILISPASPELPGRAHSLGVSPDDYKADIASSVRRLRDLRQQQHPIEGRYYEGQPNWKLIITSRTAWMQYYMPNGMHVDATPYRVLIEVLDNLLRGLNASAHKNLT